MQTNWVPCPCPSPPRPPLQVKQQRSRSFCQWVCILSPAWTCPSVSRHVHPFAYIHALILGGQIRLLLCMSFPPPLLGPHGCLNCPGRQEAENGGGALGGHISHQKPFLFPLPLPSATFLCQGHADDTRESIKCHPHVRSCHNIIKALDLRDEAVAINSESD